MRHEEVMCNFFNFSAPTYYKRKREGNLAIKFIEEYFVKEDLEEFIKTGKMGKLNYIKKYEEIKKEKTIKYLSLFIKTPYTPKELHHGFSGLRNFHDETLQMYIDFLIYLSDSSQNVKELDYLFLNFISKINVHKNCFEKNDYTNLFNCLINDDFSELLHENIQNNFLSILELTKEYKDLHEEALYHAIRYVCSKYNLDMNELQILEIEKGNKFYTIETYKKLMSNLEFN